MYGRADPSNGSGRAEPVLPALSYCERHGRHRSPLTATRRGITTAIAVAALALPLAGCGSSRDRRATPPPGPPIGVGPSAAYTPPPRGAAAHAGDPIGRLRCAPGTPGPRVGAHVELFAHRRVVVVSAGIGMAPPVRARGAYVTGARCSYPVRTREPTGLLELDPGAGPLTLGDLFAVWGQPLSARRLAGFRAPPRARVEAYLDGRPWPGDPRALPLRRHAVVVLEVSGRVPPHAGYRFPRGL